MAGHRGVGEQDQHGEAEGAGPGVQKDGRKRWAPGARENWKEQEWDPTGQGEGSAGYEMRLWATLGACGDKITGHSFLSTAVASSAHNPAQVPVTCQHLDSGQVLLRPNWKMLTQCACATKGWLHQSMPGKKQD